MTMKSAYGITTPKENVELTHVDPGTPMGELLRRFWQPVALSAELTDLPKKIKIMCEELVVFRTKEGVLDASHRIAAIAAPRSNGDALKKTAYAAATTAGFTPRTAGSPR